MSYVALGKTYTVNMKLLGKSTKVSIDIPIEQITEDARLAAIQAAQGAASGAIDAAWSFVQQKLYGELPKVMDAALNKAKPVLRQEVDRTLNKATSAAAMVATGLAVVVIGSAMWIRKSVRGR